MMRKTFADGEVSNWKFIQTSNIDNLKLQCHLCIWYTCLFDLKFLYSETIVAQITCHPICYIWRLIETLLKRKSHILYNFWKCSCNLNNDFCICKNILACDPNWFIRSYCTYFYHIHENHGQNCDFLDLGHWCA